MLSFFYTFLHKENNRRSNYHINVIVALKQLYNANIKQYTMTKSIPKHQLLLRGLQLWLLPDKESQKIRGKIHLEVDVTHGVISK